MGWKLCLISLFAMCLALGVLLSRQQKVSIERRIAQLDQKILDAQRRLWQAESDAARLTSPPKLLERTELMKIQLEPVVPLMIESQPSRSIADAGHDLLRGERVVEP